MAETKAFQVRCTKIMSFMMSTYVGFGNSLVDMAAHFDNDYSSQWVFSLVSFFRTDIPVDYDIPQYHY
jgi:hypothetical protein